MKRLFILIIPVILNAVNSGSHHSMQSYHDYICVAYMSLDSITQSDSGTNIIARNAVPKLISNQFKFTEGPTVDKFGNVFFTDQPNDRIMKYGIDGQLTVFLEKTGRANGMRFEKNGNLLTCSDEPNQIWSINPQGKIKVLLDNFRGQRFNGPNDLWIDGKGGIYFTDPYYQRPYWTRKKADLNKETVYYLAKGKKSAIIVDDKLVKPNGITGSADGKYLFVSDIKDEKTYKYRIASDGRLTDRQLFIKQGSDGMTLDNRGNLYLTGNGVTVYNPNGEKIEFIPIPSWTGNLCFGGKERDYLFITASESVYTLQMNVKGVNF